MVFRRLLFRSDELPRTGNSTTLVPQMADILTRVSRKTAKAILTFGMIEPEDRVLLALSGGKDSTTLAYHLARKQPSFPVPFEVEALHLHTEECTCGRHPEIWDLVRSWGITLHTHEYSIHKRLKPGRRMNCYWCATQRRTELLRFAEAHGFSRIALGHHQDDIIETFFMNMIFKGELSTMLPVMSYDRYPQVVIRPLALVKEEEIIECAEELGIARISCACGHDTRSKRRDVRRHIEEICRGRPYVKDNILRSMANPLLRYLLVDERAPREGW